MRLFRLTAYYPAYLRQVYQEADLAGRPFAEQHARLVEGCHGWSDYWSQALKPLGYEVWEPAANARQAQWRWAEEHGFEPEAEGWLESIALAQVQDFRPEVLLVNDPLTFSAAFLRRLRSACPSLKRIVGWIGAPCGTPEVFAEYDLILSNIPGFVERFRSQGLRSEHLAHGFCARILERIDRTAPAEIPFSFLGSLVRHAGFHNERERLLAHLCARSNLQIWADFDERSLFRHALLTLRNTTRNLARQVVAIPGLRASLGRTPLGQRLLARPTPPLAPRRLLPPLRGRVRPPVFGRQMFQLLCQSRLTLNTHIDASGPWASNMRLFEATGVGACLLTDWKDDLPRYFEPDREVVAYRTPAEAVEKACWLLEHDPERRRIAERGQQRTLQTHNLNLRAVELDALIRKIM